MDIREIEEKDAEKLLNLCRQLDQETPFMMLEPGERNTTIEEQRNGIRKILTQANQMIFVVEHEEELIGYLAALGGTYHRNRHSAYLVIGIRQPFTGQGLGARLFRQLERWACQHNIHRLELTVMAHNKAALALYHKAGFEIEGTKKDALFVNGVYVDEYYMAKLL
jgi:RimJ/RimL family protein N-acetyltransferase